MFRDESLRPRGGGFQRRQIRSITDIAKRDAHIPQKSRALDTANR